MNKITSSIILFFFLSAFWACPGNTPGSGTTCEPCTYDESTAITDPHGAGITVPPPGKFYHGVYPGGETGEEDDITPDDVNSYELSVNKQVAWVYFSNNWFSSRSFPLATASWIRSRGAIPFIRLMLRSSTDLDVSEPVFTLAAILRGDFDPDLRAWANSAKAFATPLAVEWGTEMNGLWFPWNGGWNCGGDEGPKRFAAAFRHIVRVMSARGGKQYNLGVPYQ